MTIDWKGKLECDLGKLTTDGDYEHLYVNVFLNRYTAGVIAYAVDIKSGCPINNNLPNNPFAVRNSKYMKDKIADSLAKTALHDSIGYSGCQAQAAKILAMIAEDK